MIGKINREFNQKRIIIKYVENKSKKEIIINQ